MKLKELIFAAQNYDESAMNELIEKFKPAIDGHTKRMNGDEDFRSDMILFLIDLIHRLNLPNMRIQSDYALISYISKSLRHQYISLSKKRAEIKEYENLYDRKDIEIWLGVDYETGDRLEDLLTEAVMNSILTNREYICVKLMVLERVSSSRAAKMLGITRQTANEAKLRGLKKLTSELSRK